jgi:N-formylmaleamate deformylase
MAAWSEHDVRANGLAIHYLRTGGARPPVLLLHGLTDDGACWSRLAAALAPDYDVVMPDARGHGRSDAPAPPYTIDDLAADALALIDAIGLDRPAIVGHSMGALTAAVAAALAPEKIRGLVLEDPSFRPPEEWAERAALDPEAERREVLALGEEGLIAQGRAANPAWSPDTFPHWARAKLLVRPEAFSWFATPKPAPFDLVPRIGVPALVITGDPGRGAIVSATLAARMCALNPLVQVAHIPKVGHCIRYEQPDRYAALVRTFLAGLS